MLEKPKNYEEAIKIIVDSVTDDFTAKYKKAYIIRAVLIAAIGLSVAAIAGLVTQNLVWTTAMLPAVGVISFSGVIPIISLNRHLKRITNGDYFARNSEEHVMEIASTYVDQYNNFKRRNEEKAK